MVLCERLLRIVDRGEDGAIVHSSDLFASNVRLMEVLARKSGRRFGHEMDKVLDWNNNIGVLVIVVTFLDIQRKEMMMKLVPSQGSWLSDCSRCEPEIVADELVHNDIVLGDGVSGMIALNILRLNMTS